MKLKDFMAAMSAIESDRKLTKEVVVSALEEALSKAFRKQIEIPDALVRVDINEKSGEIHVYQQRTVVETVEDDELEIALADAKALNQEYVLGDLVDSEVDITKLGRAAVILAKNVMKQKIREAEKQVIYDEYCDKVEEMVVGTVETVEEKFALVNIGKTLALMPRTAQIPGERYYENQRLRVVITEVNKETKGAQVLVSRANAALVKRLFEKEVPEIYQGVIEIRAIARDAGERTKMAVYSHNENVDPIGACIGPRGSRVQVIIEELGGEKIDIFEWSEDVSELIKNALSPAEVLAVIPSEEKRGLLVVVADHQLSLAIGKKGKNARLAVKLTGNKIDIKSESDVEAMGIDWRAIAIRQQEEARAKLEERRALEQMEHFASVRNEMEQEESVLPEEIHTPIIEEYVADVIAQEENRDAAVAESKENAPLETTVVVDELEEAARIAKEKKKASGMSVKHEYVSKLEQLADASGKSEEKTVSRKKRTEKEDKEERRKPTFDPKKRDYEFKPIYSEEELAEIARQEEEERANDWINDDIDFDEYDEYYEE